MIPTRNNLISLALTTVLDNYKSKGRGMGSHTIETTNLGFDVHLFIHNEESWKVQLFLDGTEPVVKAIVKEVKTMERIMD